MARWKLFGKSKEKKQGNEKEIDIPIIEDEEPIKQKEEVFLETSEITEEPPITEYHETLYSREHPSKKRKESLRRKSWRARALLKKMSIRLIKKRLFINKHLQAQLI